ncbi:MAG TPA: DMT family transporter [Gammaproteobacteria bacterium]|nr:DMT family transporter [Gammaproteobacteria bacterium]
MSVPAAFVGVILIWSTTPLAIKWSSEGIGFLFAISARMLIGVLLCYAVLRLLRGRLPWHRKAVQTYLASGVAIYGAMTSVYWGAQFIPSGLVSVIFGMTPIFTGVMAALWLGERIGTLPRLLGVALGIAGLVVVFGHDLFATHLEPQALWGMAAVLLATFLHSMSMVLVKGIGAGLPAVTGTTGGLLVSTPALLLTWWLAGGVLPEAPPPRAIGAIVYLGVFGSALGFVLFFYALRHLEAGRMALIPLITPVLALLLGYLLADEVIPGERLAGAALILFGLLVFEWELLARSWRRRSETVTESAEP